MGSPIYAAPVTAANKQAYNAIANPRACAQGLNEPRTVRMVNFKVGSLVFRVVTVHEHLRYAVSCSRLRSEVGRQPAPLSASCEAFGAKFDSSCLGY